MDALTEALSEGMSAAPRISVFGLFTVSEGVLTCFILSVALSLLAILLTRNLSRTPGKVQTVLELGIGLFNDFCKRYFGKHWRPLAPWIGTVALFLASCNLASIFGLTPPTRELSITAALAVCSAVLIYGSQLYYRGFFKGLRHFASPTPILLPINLMEIIIRPLSLCMRLFGNVLAAHLVMEMIHAVVPVVVPAFFSIYFDLFDGLIQTLVFVFLTVIFTGEAIGEEESEHEIATPPPRERIPQSPNAQR